jgi:hypothetical protein
VKRSPILSMNLFLLIGLSMEEGGTWVERWLVEVRTRRLVEAIARLMGRPAVTRALMMGTFKEVSFSEGSPSWFLNLSAGVV